MIFCLISYPNVTHSGQYHSQLYRRPGLLVIIFPLQLATQHFPAKNRKKKGVSMIYEEIVILKLNEGLIYFT